MGAAIAAAHCERFQPVVLFDTNERALVQARKNIVAELECGHLGRQAARVADQLIEDGRDSTLLTGCDLVLEAIAEKTAAKQQLYAQIEPHLGPDAILASNTSTIPIGRLGLKLADPSRFCGLHFCHPVRQRPLVEVIRGPKTSERTIEAVVAHVRALGKMPIIVKDGPGFVVNRLLMTYLGEALALVIEGVPIEEIDGAMTEFGMSMGPIEMMDEIGLDTALQSGVVLSEIFGDRLAGTQLLVSMVKAKQFGCKSGAGFFVYPERSINPAVSRFLARWGRAPSPVRCSIPHRLLFPMVLEATRILDEGKVRDVRDIDLAVLFGLGFPAFQGGLLWWADGLRATAVLRLLGGMASLGPQFLPTPMLCAMASCKARFSGEASTKS
jgi:3-hydroxyacyl-CoA dehydrogenase/enoyl-CoA hydratase/3-hydroxybutyryl-CoA epimerase/3-hydroxyacyl-CoA dehydrogenase/enoyl-CoA hydratase/3-hydroxybutyryl-CoA epimerase/enoyl-CoA isomerase